MNSRRFAARASVLALALAAVAAGAQSVDPLAEKFGARESVRDIGISPEGETLNINADTFASALAARMQAKRLLLLTDVEGVLDKDGNLIADLSITEAQELIRNGTITGGMIPKMEGCIEVVEAGVEAVVIINGKVPHSVLLSSVWGESPLGDTGQLRVYVGYLRNKLGDDPADPRYVCNHWGVGYRLARLPVEVSRRDDSAVS